MNKTTLLETRNKMKKKKPEFERQDSNIFKQFEGQWRRPRGIHSKMRRGFRGHKAMPAIGFSSPSAVKGLTKRGLKPVRVLNVSDLDKLTNDCVAVIGATIGTKKRVDILKTAKEKKIVVLGFKDIDAYIAKVALGLSQRKKNKKVKVEPQEKPKDEKKIEEKKDESKK